MLIMLVERFDRADVVAIYRRVRDEGRGLPDGLRYVDSWVEAGFGRCFQLMECDDLAALQAWILRSRDLGVAFEVVPVLTSRETQAVVAPFLDRP